MPLTGMPGEKAFGILLGEGSSLGILERNIFIVGKGGFGWSRFPGLTRSGEDDDGIISGIADQIGVYVATGPCG
jgi:hypothetical protein